MKIQIAALMVATLGLVAATGHEAYATSHRQMGKQDHSTTVKDKASETVDVGLLMPIMDPARGRKVFAEKGCVVCHALNGVGGDHGPNLDMSEMRPMNPFEFAAKMWRGAEAMIILQREELGEAVELNGQELADIIAFVHNPDEVAKFSEADIPHRILDILKKTHGEETGHPHKEDDKEHRKE